MKEDSTLYTLHSTPAKPILLISASDSSAAAGMQNDLRVLADLGVPARCAVTAVTVQGDGGAGSINPVDPMVILDAINTALSDKPGISGVKVGLLGNEMTAGVLEDPLATIHATGIPIVVDPVMRSTTGSVLSTGDTAAAVLEKILPSCTLVTPNRDELARLSEAAGVSKGDEETMVKGLLGQNAGAVLVTGGDTSQDQIVDALYISGDGISRFEHPKIGTRTPRGTGCALSTAIAAHLGAGLNLQQAIRHSIDYVADRIRRSAVVGEQLLLFPGKNSDQ